MKEWDMESAQRRFLKTLAVFPDIGTAYINDIEPHDNAYVYIVETLKLKNHICEIDPSYWHVKSRLYNTSTGLVALNRKINKSYKIGVCDENFDMLVIKGGNSLKKLNLLSKITINIQKALEKLGPLNDKLWINEKEVFFLNKQVGYRKGSNFVVAPFIEQELKDALVGTQCIINQ